MDLKQLKYNWDKFGQLDPFWAILTDNNKKGNKWKSDEFFETGKREIEGLLNSIKDSDIDLSNKKALDFGCGAGRLTQALAPYFDQVYGVDISTSMLELANKYNSYQHKCQYYLNETDNLKLFEDNHFDFIYSNITLQHMKPMYSQKYIQEFVRILSPGGILVFQLPSERKLATNQTQTKEKSGIVPSAIKVVKSMIPWSLLNLYRKIRYGQDWSKRISMEMYGTKKEEVIKLIQELENTEIVNVKPNNSAGNQWISFQYWVKKL
ncbi:MAG: class I SAM-dependent methyltransferase [Crocosphaera sp.]|nr:class I SAM-dependent methyltransferase [Crocosphaera sp.]